MSLYRDLQRLDRRSVSQWRAESTALIGRFALSEGFVMIEQETIVSQAGQERMQRATWKAAVEGVRLALRHWWEVIWTSMMGLVIGITPGAGTSIASLIAYQQSRVFSKTPGKYGTGHPTGVIAPREFLFDMWLALAFGLIGYIARKTGYHVAAILIGVILGSLVEQSYLRALRIGGGDPMVLFSSTIGNVLWGLLALSIVVPYFNTRRKRRRDRQSNTA